MTVTARRFCCVFTSRASTRKYRIEKNKKCLRAGLFNSFLFPHLKRSGKKQFLFQMVRGHMGNERFQRLHCYTDISKSLICKTFVFTDTERKGKQLVDLSCFSLWLIKMIEKMNMDNCQEDDAKGRSIIQHMNTCSALTRYYTFINYKLISIIFVFNIYVDSLIFCDLSSIPWVHYENVEKKLTERLKIYWIS